MKEVEKHAKSLGSDLSTTLAWLWRVVVRPCLDQLGFNQPHPHSSGRWRRVWWIPTGALSHFPLHAAGRHCETSGETAIDRVMSSYSSSIKTLMFARRQHNPKSADSAPGNALLIGMPQTPGLSTLPSAADEVAIVEKLCPSLQLKAVKPSSNCRGEVLEKLHSCKSFHFAGHGESNSSDPSKSRLFLTDWETTSLTVEDLFQHWLREHHLFLAYLSACSTGAMKYVYLADEAIHLISACQLAGFRHVVGTLWEVEDGYSVDAAKSFYGALEEEWNDKAVALGAHNAARLLRRETNGWNLGAHYAARAGG
ncbi:CHAT domain-containing protein [Ilyonectria robusta]|uniref:CHAT domain-containing protein n=1 Tax=Ilyonectria robusta TaxID=1079257 RepID=UPI001E8D67AE|nr:CHAT domain-containing protein [Ilyonectria robusta]KAH8683912.1 CHAT domain-containing protein [Ilyonectria robusta]